MSYQLDSETIGSLYKRVRLSRQLDTKDIVEHFRLSQPTITRIEKKGASRASSQQYILALKSKLACPPLTSQQAEHLLQLHDLSREKKVYELEAEFAALSLSDIKTAAASHHNSQLRDLHEVFRSYHRPALLCDDLWFVHALNGALLDLFYMHQDAPFMYDWKTWHKLATKLHQKSPLLERQKESDHLLPATVQLFHAYSYRYLFTTQHQHLIKALSSLSAQNGMQFEHCWLQATTYAYTYAPQVLNNLPKKYTDLADNQIQVELQPQGTYSITLDGDCTVNYRLMTWSPLPGHEFSEERFKQLQHSGRCQKIYYAVDYDKNKNFHVNTWPEVQRVLATRDF